MVYFIISRGQSSYQQSPHQTISPDTRKPLPLPPSPGRTISTMLPPSVEAHFIPTKPPPPVSHHFTSLALPKFRRQTKVRDNNARRVMP